MEWIRDLQPSCKVVTTLLGSEHLVQNDTILTNVARLLQPRNFHMGSYVAAENF